MILSYSDVLCTDAFTSILYIENGINENIKKQCILQSAFIASNMYLKESKDIMPPYGENKMKGILFLDGLRTFLIHSPNKCRVGRDFDFEYEHFDFEKSQIKERKNTFMVYLTIKKHGHEKTTINVAISIR